MSDLARWRAHIIFSVDQLTRPYSFRTDVWARDPLAAWEAAEKMFALMAAEADMTNARTSRMSCDKAPLDLMGESPGAPYAAPQGPSERS